MNAIAPTAADELIQFIRSTIPLSRAMDLRLQAYDGERITLSAPLSPNVNDKGCAFGGSLASLLTLAGWSLVELALRHRGEDCDVYVGESSVRYLEPVWGEIRAQAELSEDANWHTFFATLEARGKARIEVTCRVPGLAVKSAATLTARFVAKRR